MGISVAANSDFNSDCRGCVHIKYTSPPLIRVDGNESTQRDTVEDSCAVQENLQGVGRCFERKNHPTGGLSVASDNRTQLFHVG